MTEADRDGEPFFDGAWIDDVNVYPGHGWDGRVAEYTDSVYRDEAVEFARWLGRRFTSLGKRAIANVGIQPAEEEQRDALVQIARSLNGVGREQFVRFGGGPLFTSPPTQGGLDLAAEIDLMTRVQRAGGDFVAMTYGSTAGITEDEQAYARAAYLIGWDGAPGSALMVRTEDGVDPAGLAAWQISLGTPLEPASQVEPGVWRRRYSRGVVVLNANPEVSVRVDLGGSYEQGEGSCVDSVEQGPVSASFLAGPLAGNC
jgi:hypothetical protein